MKPPHKRPIGQQVATPKRSVAAPAEKLPPSSRAGPGLALPHERDESTRHTSQDSPEVADSPVDPLMAQAKRDLDAGLVDTDMRATPGLDAERRARLVPGAGGRPPPPHRRGARPENEEADPRDGRRSDLPTAER